MTNTEPLWSADPGHLSVARSLLDQTRRGRGQVLVAVGHLGTGKTSLLDQIQRLGLESGTPVLRARADRAERELPFGVIRQLVHGLSLQPPAVGAGPRQPGSASAESAAWRLLDLGRDSSTGLLLLVDDAEQTDECSLATLCALALRLPGVPVSVVLAAGESVSPVGLDRLRARGRVLALRPLSPARVEGVVHTCLPDASPGYLHAVTGDTGGLPVLLAAVLRDPPPLELVGRAVPAPVRHRVRAVLSEQGPAARRIAEAVAVLGPGAELRDARALAVLGQEEAGGSADALAAVGLLAPGPLLRFAQPMLGRAVLDGVAVHARSSLHRRAAGLLAGGPTDPDLVDEHLMATEPRGETWVTGRLTAAAHRAAERDDLPAVVRWLSRAAAEPPPPQHEAAVLLRLAGAKITLGDAGAAADLQRVLRLADSSETVGHARKLLTQLWLLQGDTPAGLAVVENALRGVDVRDPAQGPLVSRHLTMTVLNAEYRDRADVVAAPLLAAARQGLLPQDPGVAAHVALRLAWEGAPTDLVARVVERAFSSDPLIDPESQGALLGFAVRALVATDRLEEAARVSTDALETARARGMVFGASYASYHRGLVRLEQGALAAALADVLASGEAAAKGWRGADPWRGELLARIHLARGEPGAAREALGLTDGAPETSLGFAFVMDARARLALADGHPGEALGHALTAHRCLEAFHQDTPVLVPWRQTAARAAYALQRRQQAQRLAMDSVARARLTRSASTLGAALTTAGAVSPVARAVPLLQEACELLEGSPARLTQSRALVVLGRVLRQTGRRANAREPLRRGLAVAVSAQAQPLARLARDELAAAGARTRREAVTGPDSLTPSERRVAYLALAGRTNAGIANELSVTVKTVETHLGQTYRKLAISGRSELARALDGSSVVGRT